MKKNSHPSENYIIGIDGCRALACLGVFIVNYLNKAGFDSGQHFLDLGHISGRFGIVTLIVLSGFGLSIPFWRAIMREQRQPSTVNFWIRRFLRITPLYFVCLVALIVHNEVWKESQGWTDILLHFTFLYNYSNEFYYSLNPVFWVLAFFIHFYLVLPLLFRIGKGGTKNALSVFISVMLLSYLAHAYLSSLADANASGLHNPVARKSFFAYLPHFLTGTLAGWLYLVCDRNCRFKNSRFFSWLAFWLFMALIVAGLGTRIVEYAELPYAVYHFPVIPVLVALLITSAAMGSASTFLESTPVRYFAILSYGVFVFHYPVINLSLRLLPKLGINPDQHVLLTGIFVLLVTTCIAALTYVFIEKPVSAASRRYFK